MLTVYADETGHPRGEEFFIVGGLLSSANSWGQLTSEWDHAKSDYDFPVGADGEFVSFHATDFFSGGGAFRNYNIAEEAKRELYRRFLLAMIRHVEASAFTIVLNDVWRTYVSGDAARMTEVYSVAAIGLASRFFHWSKRRQEGPIHYVFERATGCHQGPALTELRRLAVERGNDLHIGSVSSSPKGLAPLDASDIWCYELRQYVRSLISTGSEEPSDEMIALMQIHQQCGFVFDEPGTLLFLDHLVRTRGNARTTEAPMQAVPIPVRITP